MSGWFHKSGSRPNPSDDEGSVSESAALFRQGLEEHLQARAELLGLEAREAGELAARKALFGIVIAVLLFFAYALLLVAGISLLGSWLAGAWPDTFARTGWQLIALLLGILHLVLALILFGKLKRQPEPKLFEFTRAEFQKDREWLRQKNNRTGTESDNSR